MLSRESGIEPAFSPCQEGVLPLDDLCKTCVLMAIGGTWRPVEHDALPLDDRVTFGEDSNLHFRVASGEDPSAYGAGLWDESTGKSLKSTRRLYGGWLT